MQEEPQPKKSGLGLCCLIQCFILILLLCGVFVGLAYHLGSDDYHSDVPHSLGTVFEGQEQKDLIKKLGKKSHQWTILHGPVENGIYEFMEYYADYRAAKGKSVIVRRHYNHMFETALKVLRGSKDFFEQNFNIEQDSDKTEWVFIIKDGEVPLDEIDVIKQRHPKDRIIIGQQEKLKVAGFKNVEYPGITLEEIEQTMVEEFDISEREAALLTKFYGSVPEVMENMDHLTYNHAEHLGLYYNNLKRLDEHQKTVLEQLCGSGVAKVKKDAPNLESAGVVVHNKKGYWVNRKNILNYELINIVDCVDQVVSDQVMAAIQQEEKEAKKKQKEEKKVKEQKKKKETKKKDEKKKDEKKKKNKKDSP